MADISKHDIQEMLDAQSKRFEVRTREIVKEVTTEVVVEAINQVVMPVLEEVLEKQDEILDRLDPLEHRHDLQQISLDDHDARIAALEVKVS